MKILIGLFWVALFFGGANFASAANFFNWGVETNKMYYGATPSQYNLQYFGGTTKDCTEAHGGSCAMKLQVIGNDSGNQSMGADTIQWNPPYVWGAIGGHSVYYRWWMKMMPGFSWGSGTAKTKASRVISGPQGYTGYLVDHGFLVGECGDYGGCLAADGSKGTDYNLYVPFNFRNQDDGIWHEYIVRVKSNTFADCIGGVNCDAELEAWVDGVSVGQYKNFKLHNANESANEAWGSWMVRPYFQLNGTINDGGTIYLDDFSTDDAYNSLLTKNYSIADFTALVSGWLQNSAQDFNSDNIINAKDLGLMMSKWQ